MKHTLRNIILGLLITLLVNANNANDVFIIGDNFCLTNGTSAIYFTNTDGKGDQESKIYPDPPLSPINCDSKTEECKGWYIGQNVERRDSYRTFSPSIITDKRWESFPTIITQQSKYGRTYYYKEVDDIDDNMSIAFSVKAKYESHIFLCESSITSNCYWIMLGGNSGQLSAYRKCSTNQIPVPLKTYAVGSCRTNHNPLEDNPLDENNWKHFVIQKFRNLLRLLIYRGKKDGLTTYMELDDENYIIPKKLFLHYKSTTGHALWKLHKYYNFESSGEADLSSAHFLPRNGIICVSMFVKTSSQGTLEIEITDRNSVMETRELNTNNTWQEIKMIVKADINYIYWVNIFHHGISTDTWAVDGIRECNEIEYRYIAADGFDSLNCQRLEDQLTLNINKRTSTTSKETNCSESTFGESCIPCDIFGKQFCKSFKYCELRTQKCFCTAGYQNANCEECPDKFYGHGCKKYSHCNTRPNNTDGFCYEGNCIDPYIGDSCHDVKFPFFLNPPTVYTVTARGFNLVQDNLTREGYAESYFFQYSKADQANWITINQRDISVDISQVIEVHDGVFSIDPDTEYVVRAVLRTKGRDLVPKSTTTAKVVTECVHLTEDKIHITTESTAADIELSFPTDHCQFLKYQFAVDTQNYQSLKPKNLNIRVSKLKPYTLHKFYVKYTPTDNKTERIITKDFMTRQAEPSIITKFKHSVTSTTISLSWEKPDEGNGKISGYLIRYKVLRHLACQQNDESEFSHETTKDTSKTLKMLKPYTRYEVHIQAINDEFLGKDFSTFIETMPLRSMFFYIFSL
ncbi:uncharacterized protein LOC126887030 [Diabrotica virgifera virgifera]|uniref:Fibronectin type-III domain-containing protein n=1 Tax=Diabrotica virgifera virgifera TaxID=50390 RepID=A0ABM5KJA1_DIAVI|nr:uncharacterized protein LOC126887030 [Diabrotica virgifera virgifera]